MQSQRLNKTLNFQQHLPFLTSRHLTDENLPTSASKMKHSGIGVVFEDTLYSKSHPHKKLLHRGKILVEVGKQKGVVISMFEYFENLGL